MVAGVNVHVRLCASAVLGLILVEVASVIVGVVAGLGVVVVPSPLFVLSVWWHFTFVCSFCGAKHSPQLGQNAKSKLPESRVKIST